MGRGGPGGCWAWVLTIPSAALIAAVTYRVVAAF